MKIQVDMFEVQLGAAMLLQFETIDGVVRILADGGVTGYQEDHVLKKLPEAFSTFDQNAPRRIDLIVGTHYDADHLDGLVPIIEDHSIDIGEAWLPPVANDAEPHAIEDRPQGSNLLALQFAADDGPAVLADYLRHKAAICNALANVERRADEVVGFKREETFNERETIDQVEHGFLVKGDFFDRHLQDAELTLGVSSPDHAEEEVVEPRELELWLREDPLFLYQEPERLNNFLKRWERHPGLAENEAKSLAFIRRSAAKDAINAKSLEKVVKALKDRNLSIRCATIPDGQPRRFIWEAARRRFTPSAAGASNGPEILLLAPSDGLVKRHWDRLPIGDYAKLAMLTRLPVKSITPSNQLSYVLRIASHEQNILISGDAGFVDFKERGNKPFHQALIDTLSPLHVVQVAHHGGNNGHFYNGLLASGYANQMIESSLLLSHGINDKYRPSDLFAKFVEMIRNAKRPLNILFTSQPQDKFVRDFAPLVGPVTGGAASDRGDVRLEFGSQGWQLTRHLIQV